MYSDSEVQKLKGFGFGEISTSANINYGRGGTNKSVWGDHLIPVSYRFLKAGLGLVVK